PEDAWKSRVRQLAEPLLSHAPGSSPSPLPRASAPLRETLLDITPAITEKLGVWPGDTKPSREVLCDIAKGDTITLSTLRATVHLGAHADGPNHYGKDQPGIGERPLHHYLGPCHVIEARVPRSSRVSIKDLGTPPETLRHPRILLKTSTFPDPNHWNQD